MISPTNYKLLFFLNLAKVHVGKERFTNIPDTKKRAEFIHAGLFWSDRYAYFGKHTMGREWSGPIDKCAESQKLREMGK